MSGFSSFALNWLFLFTLLSGLIGFCIVFGITIGKMGHEAQVMIDFFDVLSEVVMRIVNIVMWYDYSVLWTLQLFSNTWIAQIYHDFTNIQWYLNCTDISDTCLFTIFQYSIKGVKPICYFYFLLWKKVCSSEYANIT